MDVASRSGNDLKVAQVPQFAGISAQSIDQLSELAALLLIQAEAMQFNTSQLVIGAKELAGGQRRLAAALDVKELTVRNWKTGITSPSLIKLQALCAFVTTSAKKLAREGDSK